MRKLNRSAILLVGLALACTRSPHVFAGTNPAAFLNSGVGARALGMGGAFTSVSDDSTAMYWNPAGLGKINRYSLVAMSQSLGSAQWDTLEDITPKYQFVGFTIPVNSFSIPGLNNTSNTFGIGMISSGLSDIPYTSVDGTGKITRDTFEDTENAYFISYGAPLFQSSDSLYVGATLKYITQQFSKISGASASGYDMDFGAIFSFGALNLGFVLQRGVDLRWANGHADSGSLTTKFGVSNKFTLKGNLSLLGSADVVQRQNQPLLAGFGAELGYEKDEIYHSIDIGGLFLRLGVDGYAMEDRYEYKSFINNNMNYTAGLGIKLFLFGYKAQFDYAMGSYRLGNKNRLSVNLYF